MMDPIEPALEPESTTAPIEPAPQPEPAPAPAEAPQAAQPAQEQQHPFWYRKEIEKERKARAALERQIEQLAARQPQSQPQAAPDPLEDPNAFYGHIQQTIERQRVVDRLERSEDRFTDKHGEQALEEVRDWLSTRPDIEQWALGQRDPWRAAHQQFTKEKLASEIGDNPEDWRNRERERLRQELLAEMGGGPAPAPEPQMRPRLPASAASVRSAPPRHPTTGQFQPKNRF